MVSKLKPGQIDAGVVGLGLMGTSIVVALLAAGHRVKAIAPIPQDELNAIKRITEHLEACAKLNILQQPIQAYLSRLTVSMDYNELKYCGIVQECVIEQLGIKKEVYQKITDVVSENTVICSNTSAIPISTLQQHIKNPERFMGIHWAEPAFATRFLEITCGKETNPDQAKRMCRLAHYWAKEPTFLKKDIRGFVTNRLMYAVYREALSIVEKGDATLEDADKAFQYDAGSWMTMMGIFRRMDFEGLKDHQRALENIIPSLSNRADVPLVMQRMVDLGARGIHNQSGLYHYSTEESAQWESAFAAFNKDIYELTKLYPADVVDTKLNKKNHD